MSVMGIIRMLSVVLMATVACINGSFQNAVAGLLAHKRMLLVGSSFVVNLFHVTELTRSDLLLTGNLHVPVPAVCTR